MRSRFLNSRLLEIVLVSGLVAGCGGAASVAGAAPDEPLKGPQGTVGQFAVECEFSHYAPDDPIVHPGHAGASHLHQFYGADGVDADSQYDELVNGATTCDQQADTASYWAPVLVDADRIPVPPIKSVAYYRAGEGVDPTLVVPYPPGLMLVGGNAHAVDEQPVSVVAWSCGTGSVRAATPPDCSRAQSLRMMVTYPDCWNGRDLRTDDYFDPDKRHAVYSSGGECPDQFPVHIPQLQFAIDYEPVAAEDLDQLTLSSGDIRSGHADFWNTWDQDKLANEVTHCINRNLVCNVSG